MLPSAHIKQLSNRVVRIIENLSIYYDILPDVVYKLGKNY